MSNSKRKILFLVESLDSGDAGKALSVLVQYIDKTKYDIAVGSVLYDEDQNYILTEGDAYITQTQMVSSIRWFIVIFLCRWFINSLFPRGMMWRLPTRKVL